jgi:2-polyprenyl-3-methyl-5-hydroxy-6-metoxy-1,4-benzoquinol methylase
MVGDESNGYDFKATQFAAIRGKSDIGIASVRSWVRTFMPQSAILDIGCGTGIPITKVLVDEGMNVYGIDASPSMVTLFRQNFPGVPVACETAETSRFFDRKFDGIIAWGLIFLMPKDKQIKIIQQAAAALNTGGNLLFTAPLQRTEWNDVFTGNLSLSLGSEGYKEILSASGLTLTGEFEDEGENYYYSASKV